MSKASPPKRALSDEEYRNRLAGPAMTPLTETARRVLESRYLRRDSSGSLCESHDELLRRVEPFERGLPFDPEMIDEAYYRMLFAIVEHEAAVGPIYTNVVMPFLLD